MSQGRDTRACWPECNTIVIRQYSIWASRAAQLGPIKTFYMPADPSLHCWVLSMASKTAGRILVMLCRSSDLPAQKYPDLCCAHAHFLIILRPTQTFGAQIFWSTTVIKINKNQNKKQPSRVYTSMLQQFKSTSKGQGSLDPRKSP